MKNGVAITLSGVALLAGGAVLLDHDAKAQANRGRFSRGSGNLTGSKRELARQLVHAARGGQVRARVILPLIERMTEEEARAVLESLRSIVEDANQDARHQARRRFMSGRWPP